MFKKNIKFIIITRNQYKYVKNRFYKMKDNIIYVVKNSHKIVYKK